MTVHIPVHRYGKIVDWALIDTPDFALIRAYRWTRGRDGYARRDAGKHGTVFMHREVLGLVRGDGMKIDHRNGVRLDNRRSNLRIATIAENGQNRHYGYGSSKYRGVCWNRKSQKWQAGVELDGKKHYLGLFDNEESAADAAAAFRAAHMPFSTDATRALTNAV